MKIAKKVFLYAFSAILVISYFVILYISMNPNVSWEYKLYYIEKETDIWPGNHGYDYELGTKIETNLKNKQNCKRFGKGWGEYTKTGLWSNGEKSNIYFGNLPNKDLIFEMETTKCLLNKKIEVYFNDKLKGEIEKEELEKENKIVKEVRKEDIIDGKLIITLKYTEVAEDEKVQKIMCKGINLYEV